jgi:hypothetical protein
MHSNGGSGTPSPKVDFSKIGQQIVSIMVAAVLGWLLAYAMLGNKVTANTTAIAANAASRQELVMTVRELNATLIDLRLAVRSLEANVRALENKMK